MGKNGPCCHCGVTSTPLWRNGPPEKPVLCNACGSRWRTKGSLVNYTPLHARAETDGFSHYRVSAVKAISNKNKEPKVLKRKFINDVAEYKVLLPSYNQELRKGFDEDTSNRSSSGSAISNCESSALCGSADASDLTGPPQPVVWDTMVPPRKKTLITPQKPSALEKLTKDLYTIWYEQQSSCLSESSENDLLFDTDEPMTSIEFGHGSVLIREEESEASSLSFGHKEHTVNLQGINSPSCIEEEGVNSSSREIEKIKKPAYLEPGP